MKMEIRQNKEQIKQMIIILKIPQQITIVVMEIQQQKIQMTSKQKQKVVMDIILEDMRREQ